MTENLFGKSRRKLTMLYSFVMIIFLAVLIFGWWGVFVVAFWALAAYAETKSSS